MDIKKWMQRNFLKLNCNKSEILIICPLHDPIQEFKVNIDGSIVTPATQNPQPWRQEWEGGVKP